MHNACHMFYSYEIENPDLFYTNSSPAGISHDIARFTWQILMTEKASCMRSVLRIIFMILVKYFGVLENETP